MLETLRDLYAHQEWADAQHWRAIEQSPEAQNDPELLERLKHLHVVQRAFLTLFKNQSVDIISQLNGTLTLPELKEMAQAFSREAREYFKTVSPERLDEQILVPWFPNEFRPRLCEAALQAAMHSQHHRGQNATRLKVLGVKPPNTDYIAWVYKGRPAAPWTA